MLGKAGLSEDVLEADCTFFKVLITFRTYCMRIRVGNSYSLLVGFFVCAGKGSEGFYLEKSVMKFLSIGAHFAKSRGSGLSI